MNNTSPPFNPKLISKRSEKNQIGYLQLDPDAEPMIIGPIDSMEYRLVQSLFNPSKSGIRFRPVQQTYGRVFSIMTEKEDTYEDHYLMSKALDHFKTLLRRTMSDVRASEAGDNISFSEAPHSVIMNIYLDKLAPAL